MKQTKQTKKAGGQRDRQTGICIGYKQNDKLAVREGDTERERERERKRDTQEKLKE